MPKDSVLGAIGGTFFSGIAMITQAVKVDELFQVIIYGLAGGAAGILGKLLIKTIIDFFKKLKTKPVLENEK